MPREARLKNPSPFGDLATAEARLRREKAQAVGIEPYAFRSLDNVPIIESLLRSAGLSWDEVATPGRVLDLGCGDGDLGLALALAGHAVDLVDSPETNQNKMAMVRHLAAQLRPAGEARVFSLDVDRGLRGLAHEHSAAFALGLLYHLRNPALFLSDLAEIANYAFVSTRVIDVAGGPCNAYLVDDVELGRGDTTNYWLLTPEAFERLLRRSGWTVLARERFGARRGDAGAQDTRQAVLVASNWSVFEGGRFTYGLHQMEYGSYRWTARRFGLALRQQQSGRVLVSLRYFVPEAAATPRSFVVTAGGREIWRGQTGAMGECSLSFPVEVTAGTTALDIDCGELAGGADARSLGVVLRMGGASPLGVARA